MFIGNFVSIIAGPGAGVQTTWLWTLLQTGVQMFGYYGAAYIIDSRAYGRRRMQVCTFTLMVCCRGIAVMRRCSVCCYDMLLSRVVLWLFLCSHVVVVLTTHCLLGADGRVHGALPVLPHVRHFLRPAHRATYDAYLGFCLGYFRGFVLFSVFLWEKLEKPERIKGSPRNNMLTGH